MLKLNASYSKKVPVAGQDFSSQSYHASIEVEIPDGLSQEQLDGRIHDTFEMVRGSVEAELSATTSRPVRRFEPVGNGNRTPARQGNGDKGNQAASGKQLGYLQDIATRQGMTPEQLDDQANRMFGVATVGSLTRQEASKMIDALNGSSGSGARRKAA